MLDHRLLPLRFLVLLIALLFIGRLAVLQLGEGARWRQMSEHNYLRWVRAPAARGRILDRRGRPLATCMPALAVWLVPGEVSRGAWAELLRRLVDFGIYPDLTSAKTTLADAMRFPSYLPIRIKSDLTIKDPLVTRLEENLAFLPGLYLKVEPVRCYPEGALAAQVIGYTHEIDATQLAQRQQLGYSLGDSIGALGVERAYEDLLRGTDGGAQVEVDARGRKLNQTAELPPRPGGDVTLTLDLDVQRAAEDAMRGRMGAVVALDPASGDILAMVSTPAFDLNAPAAERTEFNRAVRGQYPPGSVFKIVTAAAGLESGAIQPGTVFTCTGSYKGLHCWDHAGHGPLDLTGALAHSCNVYFMKTADRVGVEPLAAMARRFGLGQPLNIDDVLSGSAGNVPDPAKGGKDARQWGLGETLQMGIGQADVTVTPLQSACVVAAIANGGKLVHPRVILRSGATERPASAPVSLGLSPSTIQAIDRGLRAVVNEGTASRLDPRLQIAGKTGTAQNSGADHAWFVGYAPADHPTIAIAVLVEHGGHGGVTAAPIAETVIQAYTDEHGLTRTHTDRH